MLIPDWRQAWRFLSVQAAAALALLAAAYDYLPAVREYLPDGWMKWAALLVIAARIMNQKTAGAGK